MWKHMLCSLLTSGGATTYGVSTGVSPVYHLCMHTMYCMYIHYWYTHTAPHPVGYPLEGIPHIPHEGVPGGVPPGVVQDAHVEAHAVLSTY